MQGSRARRRCSRLRQPRAAARRPLPPLPVLPIAPHPALLPLHSLARRSPLQASVPRVPCCQQAPLVVLRLLLRWFLLRHHSLPPWLLLLPCRWSLRRRRQPLPPPAHLLLSHPCRPNPVQRGRMCWPARAPNWHARMHPRHPAHQHGPQHTTHAACNCCVAARFRRVG
jgi:hypothetical protein